ncbi:MAG: ABC transporter permease [Burkholderiales bacterium]|nr:ABC transporter permease [Burkholderiales bacterium]
MTTKASPLIPNATDQLVSDRGRDPYSYFSSKGAIWAMRVMLFAAFVLLWDILVRVRVLDPFLVPPPMDMLAFWKEYFLSGGVFRDGWVTIQEMGLAFLVAASTGIVVGLLLGRFQLLNSVLSPFFDALMSMPHAALAPLFILWFGTGMASKVALAISVIFFVVVINTIAGVRNVDTQYLRLFQVLGASHAETFMKVIFPSAIPSIFAGLRLSVVYALLTVIIGEMFAAPGGWGYAIANYASVFDAAGTIGVVVIVSLFALLIVQIIRKIEDALLSWKEEV